MKWLLGLFLATAAQGGDLIVKYGAQLPQKEEGLGTCKALFVAYQGPLSKQFIYQYEGGFWADNAGMGRKSSAMTGVSGGLNVNTGPFFIQALTGPSLISRTDSVLGGAFQFNNDFGFGLRDRGNGNTIGASYKHLSSAGLSSPNRGRDFIMFRVSIGF